MTEKSIQDLYDNLGKKLKDREKQANEKAKSKLSNYYNTQNNNNIFQSQEIKNRFLRLRSSQYIDTSTLKRRIRENSHWLRKRQTLEQLTIDVLCYGLNWNRLEGTPFFLTKTSFSDFVNLNPSWENASFEDLNQSLEILLKSGLIHGNSEKGYWFEDQDNSKDIKNILLLFDNQGKLSKSFLKRKLGWNNERIAYLLDLLENQEIIVQDNENNDLYWLLNEL